VHVNRADRLGNGQYLGPDPYFDDLFCEAADAAYVSCERLVDTAELTKEAPPQTLLVNRLMVDGVVETPRGAHFTSLRPRLRPGRGFQRLYATTPWAEFTERFLAVTRAYQSAVRTWQRSGGDGRDPRARDTRTPPLPPRRVLRDRLRRGVARRRRDPGQPDGPDPLGRRPAGPAHLRAGPAAHRRRGDAAGVGRHAGEGWLPYRQVSAMVAAGRRHVMMGASQIDRYGNQNISCIGDWARPKRQLLGVRGAPGNTLNNPVSYWVPKHSPRVFVEKVDMVCGVGYDRAAAPGGRPASTASPGSCRTWACSTSRPRPLDAAASLHPGVTVEQVRRRPGSS
jgi:hypothetical protein